MIMLNIIKTRKIPILVVVVILVALFLLTIFLKNYIYTPHSEKTFSINITGFKPKNSDITIGIDKNEKEHLDVKLYDEKHTLLQPFQKFPVDDPKRTKDAEGNTLEVGYYYAYEHVSGSKVTVVVKNKTSNIIMSPVVAYKQNADYWIRLK